MVYKRGTFILGIVFMKLITGTSNPLLAAQISQKLGVPLTKTQITRFSDQEIFVEIEENVRGEDVFVIQPTSMPANDNVMELLIIIDALKRGSARRITAVLPYYGYGRQDRKTGPRTPISAKLFANLLTTAGASRVLTLDLHAAQIQGFFDIPTDNLFAAPVMAEDLEKVYKNKPITIVSPDVGGVARARNLAKRLDCDLAIIDKRREKAGVSEVMNLIGTVKGTTCILVDDIVDSAGTLCNAAGALKDKGATDVCAYVTHGVLSGPAFERISASPLSEVVVTNSIHIPEGACDKIRSLSVAPLLATAINRIANDQSVSMLFN